MRPAGRQAGRASALFLATFDDYRPGLAPDKRVTIIIIAADRYRGQLIFRYIRSLQNGPPM